SAPFQRESGGEVEWAVPVVQVVPVAVTEPLKAGSTIDGRANVPRWKGQANAAHQANQAGVGRALGRKADPAHQEIRADDGLPLARGPVGAPQVEAESHPASETDARMHLRRAFEGASSRALGARARGDEECVDAEEEGCRAPRGAGPVPHAGIQPAPSQKIKKLTIVWVRPYPPTRKSRHQDETAPGDECRGHECRVAAREPVLVSLVVQLREETRLAAESGL